MICPHCGQDNLPGNEVCSNCEQDLTPLDRRMPHSAIERSLMEDPVHKLQIKSTETIADTASVRDALHVMLDLNIGAVLVVDKEGKLRGIFSERDLLKKIAGIFDNLADLPVRDFMTAK